MFNVRVLLYHIWRVYNLKSVLTRARIVWCVNSLHCFLDSCWYLNFTSMKWNLFWLISHLIFQRQAYGERKFKILRRLPSQERRTKQGELKFSWWLRFSNSGFRNGCEKLYFTVGGWKNTGYTWVKKTYSFRLAQVTTEINIVEQGS